MMVAGNFPAKFAVVAALCVLGTSGPTAADPISQGAEHCVVHVARDDRLNLRAKPGTGQPVLARIPYASCGLIVTGSCRGKWCPIEDGHHAGWVHRHYISAVSRSTYCLSPLSHPRAVVLRACPSDGSRVLTGLVPQSCGIALLPYRVEGWQKIRQGGWEGWVRLPDLQFGDG